MNLIERNTDRLLCDEKGPGRLGKQRRKASVGWILCLAPAVYFLMVAIYALLNFSEYASDAPRLLRYVVGPLCIALTLLICAYWLKTEKRVNLGIAATSILAAMFLFEFYMTVSLLPQQVGLVGVVGEDVKLERYRRSLPPAFTLKALNTQRQVDSLDRASLSGVPDQEVILCSKDGQPVSYVADRYGFRNDGNVTEPPVDILVLGDSFMEGICLEDGDHVVDVMRKDVPSIINTGSRGSGPLFELAVLGRYGPHFKPKLTIMAFFEGNDWENLGREFQQHSYLHAALEPDGDFGTVDWSEAQRAESAEIIESWWEGSAASVSVLFRRPSLLRNFLALHQTARVFGLHYPKAVKPNPVYQDVLRRAKQMTASWGGELVVVFLPSVSQFGGLLPHSFAHDPMRNMVAAAAAQADVELIDLTPVFRTHDDPMSLYALDAHFSEEGAALAASTILQNIVIEAETAR